MAMDNKIKPRTSNGSKKKVTIIGGGVGGLTLGAKLAQRGFDVTVYEKNSDCGGRCSRVYKDGYTFEQGAILYLFDDIYKRTFQELGESMDDYVELIDHDGHHQVFFEKEKFEYSKDRSKMIAEIERIEPCGDAKEKLETFCNECKCIEKFVTENVFYKTYDYWWQMLWLLISNLLTLNLITNIKILYTAFRYTMYSIVGRYFKNDLVCQAFSFQSLYFGISPYSGSSLFSILVAYEIVTGLKYPRKGMISIVHALEKIAIKNNVKIVKNKGVNKIEIDRSAKATGVTLDDGTFVPSDIVVSNADLTYTYNALLPPTKRAVELTKKDHVPSTITFFWGMDSRIEGLKSHNIFIPSDYKKLFDDIHIHRKIPDDPSFFIHIANRMDKDLAPDKKDALTVIVPIGEMAGLNGGFEKKVQKIKKKVIAKLEKKLEMKDFASKIVTNIEPETPDSWQNKFNSWGGSILGISHSLNNLLYLRPHQECPEFSNVYFVGASTQPGAGVPLVMCSALSLAPKIEAYLDQ